MNALRNAGAVLPIADDEPHAIEPHQPFLGAHPEIPISGLHHRVDRVLRKPRLTRPDGETRLRQRPRGIERERRAAITCRDFTMGLHSSRHGRPTATFFARARSMPPRCHPDDRRRALRGLLRPTQILFRLCCFRWPPLGGTPQFPHREIYTQNRTTLRITPRHYIRGSHMAIVATPIPMPIAIVTTTRPAAIANRPVVPARAFVWKYSSRIARGSR
jgi:hypothetical protein